jgi:hypothetical protein
MSIEAMKQALEAFEHIKKYVTDDGAMPENWDAYHEKEYYALEALRQAIEQAEQWDTSDMAHRSGGLSVEQEPVAWMVRDSIDGSWYPCAFENPAGAIKGESKPLYAVPQQAEKQEPIAWMVYTLDGASAFVTDNPNDFTELHSCFALYTAPPKREWVGLTDEEIDYLEDAIDPAMYRVFARRIEAKLKEKNHD